MANYGYYRIDTDHLDNDETKIKARKYDTETTIKNVLPKDALITFLDEDPDHKGAHAKPGRGGVNYHERGFLEDRLEHKTPYDTPFPAAAKMTKTDVLYISNLSHLSAEPAVIGRIVRLIRNNTRFHLVVVSVMANSADAGDAEFFDGLENWSKLKLKKKSAVTAKRGCHPKPKHFLSGDGGDGGGNGGC